MKHIRVIASGLAAATILIGGVAFAQSAAFSSEMGVGAQSTEVTSLQTWLKNNGYYSGPVTGYYGSLTKAGVENFQSANGISATGYVGPLTLAALNAKASGSSSTSVSANSSTIAQLEAELNSLLAQIQTLEASGGTTSTTVTTPVGTSVALQTSEGAGVNGTLGTSAGTGPFTYTITTNPLNGTITSFNPTTGAFTYTPNSNYSGSDTFSYTVSNSAGTSAPMTVSVNVGSNASTGAPTGQAFSFSTANGGAYNGTLTTGSGTGPFTYSIASEPSHGTISNLNSSTGAFTYTPTSNYTGSDTFTYTVTNGAGVSSPVTVTVNDNTNGTTSGTAPTGQTLSLATAGGAALNGTLSASGTGPYTYAMVNSPAHGTISYFNPSNGAFTYIPNSGYAGTDSFTYTVSNGSGTSAASTVNITVD